MTMTNNKTRIVKARPNGELIDVIVSQLNTNGTVISKTDHVTLTRAEIATIAKQFREIT